MRIYLYIEKRLLPKARNQPKKRQKCEELKREFMELYERAKKKEENPETEKKNQTKRPFYRIKCPDGRSKTIFDRLRDRARS